MFICICNEIPVEEYEERKEECGTQCGMCLSWIEENLIPGTEENIIYNTEG